MDVSVQVRDVDEVIGEAEETEQGRWINGGGDDGEQGACEVG